MMVKEMMSLMVKEMMALMMIWWSRKDDIEQTYYLAGKPYARLLILPRIIAFMQRLP
jgi:hypothetical protein